MKFLVLAYPLLSQTDYELIQDFRREHDSQFIIAGPHFTFVFPLDGMPPNDFLKEIKNRATGTTKIQFDLRCVVVSKDAFSKRYNLFLVPEEGYSKIIRLHDQLYGGILFPHLRHDIDFIPHITIGHSDDPVLCKKMAADWNRKDFSITGIISSLQVVRLENQSLETMEEILLGEQSNMSHM